MPDQPLQYHCDLCGSDSHPTEVHQKAETKEEKEAREAEEKEQEFLSAFFELCQAWQELGCWEKKDFDYLKSEVKDYWGREGITPTKEQEERLTQIETTYGQVFNELDTLVKRFFDSPYTQGIFKRRLGQEIHSLDEASQFRQKLFQPFYEKFQRLEPKEAPGFRRTQPEFQKEYDKALEQAVNEEPEKWHESLEKLKVLPGSHHRDLNTYLKFKKPKEIRRLFSFGQQPLPLESKFGISKLELYLTEEDLLQLEDITKSAEQVLKRIKSIWLPFLEKAEEPILTAKEKAKREAEKRAYEEEARKKVEAREASKIKIRLPDNKEIFYYPEVLADIQPGARFIQKGDKAKQSWTYKGLTPAGKAVLESKSGRVSLISQEELKEKDEKAEIKGESLVREMRELFRDGFLGIEEVETAFTLQDGRKLIDFTPAEQEQAYRLLETKVNEPDIKKFLQKTPKEELARNWLLVLRLPKLKDSAPLTMKAMEEQLAPDMAARGQGKLLYFVNWYENETFYTQDTVKDGLHWQLVTKKPVSKTLNKEYSQQTAELQKAAQATRLNPDKIRRRAPIETLYDFTVFLRAKNQRIFESQYDWSDVRSSSGRLVDVGDCDAGGVRVNGIPPELSYGHLGASLSR